MDKGIRYFHFRWSDQKIPVTTLCVIDHGYACSYAIAHCSDSDDVLKQWGRTLALGRAKRGKAPQTVKSVMAAKIREALKAEKLFQHHFNRRVFQYHVALALGLELKPRDKMEAWIFGDSLNELSKKIQHQNSPDEIRGEDRSERISVRRSQGSYPLSPTGPSGLIGSLPPE